MKTRLSNTRMLPTGSNKSIITLPLKNVMIRNVEHYVISVNEEMTHQQLADLFNDTYIDAVRFLLHSKCKQEIEANEYLGKLKKIPINS